MKTNKSWTPDIEDFRQWLRSFPPDEKIGTVGYAAKCPLALYKGGPVFASHTTQRGHWADDLLTRLDTQYFFKSLTGPEILALLPAA